MELSYFASTKVCAYTEHIINDFQCVRVINKIFPHIYVITLLEDNSKLRILFTQHTLKRLGANYTICYMIRPSKKVYEEYLNIYNNVNPEDKVVLPWKPGFKCKKLTPGELGCVISHAWVLSRLENPIIKGTHLCEKNNSSSKLQLILEDDIMPIHNFETRLSTFINNHPTIQEEGKLVMLCCTDFHIHDRIINTCLDYYIPTLSKGKICCTAAYAVNISTANTLVRLLKTYMKAADHYFINIFDNIKEPGDGCVVYPRLMLTDVTSSTIDNEYTYDRCFPDTDINNYDYFPSSLLNFSPDSPNLQAAIQRLSWTSEEKSTLFRDAYSLIPQATALPTDIAVCIAFFNPAKRTRPLQNLLYCWLQMANIGIPVYIMELTYHDEVSQLSGLPNTFCVKSNSYLFHKENLWNILEKKVPEQYTKLVFLDGDILFKDPTWASKISSLLDSVSVLQPFETVEMLNATFQVDDTGVCFLKALKERQGDPLGRGHFNYPYKGLGLACRRSWLRSIGGFFDWFVMGGGDYGMIDSITRADTIKIHHCYTLQPYAHKAYDSYRTSMDIIEPYIYTYAPLRVQHMFHGIIADRQYQTRHEHTKHLQANDFQRNDDGVIEFKEPQKYNPLILAYFRNRNDDSV